MTCQGSKFILISILTFLAGVGLVQIWQGVTFQENLETRPQIAQPILTVASNQPVQIDFCEEIKKNPKYPNAKVHRGLLTVSAGILNQRVCDPLPYREIDIQSREWTKDYVMVQVTVDENGFVINASITTNSKFGKKYEKMAKNLRVRPTALSGIHVKCTGVLIFYPKDNYYKKQDSTD